MIKILFICHGNICRSTMAQYVMQELVRRAGLEGRFYIDSAATSAEEIGHMMHRGTREKLREKGVPGGDHRARQLKASDYDDYDLLIGMDHYNMKNMRRMLGGDPQGKLRLLLEYAGRPEDIADPWYTGDFEATWQDVLAGCRGLLEAIQ